MNRDRRFHARVDFLKLAHVLRCGDGVNLGDAECRSRIDDAWSDH